MRFILSRDNEILWRCDFVPMTVIKAMVDAANAAMEANLKLSDCEARRAPRRGGGKAVAE